MNNWIKLQIGKAISFNPPESISKGKETKKIPMGSLTEFQRKVNSFELSNYNSGPKFRNGDTIMAKITPCLENGKTAYVDILEDDEIAFGSSEYIVLRETAHTDSLYIYYLAISPTFRKRAISCMEGTSGRKRVSEKTLKYFELEFPPVSTQKKIAKVLSDLDAKIEINNKINQELEAMAKTLYDYWFVQFDFPDENGKPYKSSGGNMVFNEELKREIPVGWEIGNLLDIANFQNGLACQKFRPVNNNFLRVIKIKDMKEGFSEKTEKVRPDVPDKIKIFNGDILFSWSASLEVIQWSGGEGALNQHIFKVTSDKHPKSYYYFELLNYLQHFKMQAELRKTTMGHITQDHLKQSRIAIPQRDLINEIDKIIKPILDKQVKLNEENQKLSELRDWLLPMLMNGQVSVGYAEQEIETLGLVAEENEEYKKEL
jgi:type I restriction enzyme S subunit